MRELAEKRFLRLMGRSTAADDDVGVDIAAGAVDGKVVWQQGGSGADRLSELLVCRVCQ
jgi:hypothetical protein